ncbi:MAG: ATP-dependent Clp protease adaptor ClpS [Saprospiraceae bacterium]|nr:ATP-dependent Clp protease adaptor ClpS [Saprospiraceae bacterium]
MPFEFEYDTVEEILVETTVDSGDIAELIVYNDDFNTFDWVIQCFVEILQHDDVQAEQLSLIIHYAGKATVKTAPMPVLRPLKDALVDRGLSAVIETVSKV